VSDYYTVNNAKQYVIHSPPPAVIRYVWNGGDINFNLTRVPNLWVRFWVRVFFGGRWELLPEPPTPDGCREEKTSVHPCYVANCSRPGFIRGRGGVYCDMHWEERRWKDQGAYEAEL
jgi:hypothetical protein